MPRRSLGKPSRRRAAWSTSISAVSVSTVRLIVVTLGLCSLLYLILTQTIISREDSGRDLTAGGLFTPADKIFSAIAPLDDDYHQRNGDPRHIFGDPDAPRDVALLCRGGPPRVDLSYWKDIPKDKQYKSPWGESVRRDLADGNPQYVTFEPDHGGFNNIRMQMETVLVFARATGRTLVMPPAQKFYLLKKPASEFADMFPVEAFREYMDVMSTEDFLEKEGVTGRLGKIPPGKKSSGHTKEELDEYLREVAGFVPHWNHMTEALVFGLSPDQPEIPKDEVSQEWLQQFLTSQRTQLSYTEEMQKARLIHFRTSGVSHIPPEDRDGKDFEYRLFTHFYTFIGFIDPAAARHHRRLVRDVVHFRESLFCVASNIVHRLRTVGEGSPGRWAGWHGEGGGLAGSGRWDSEGGRKAGFSTFHIRRGDFQYTRMKPPASTILEATKDIRIRGEVLYIATDERDKSFFSDFKKDHRRRISAVQALTVTELCRIFFLDDFKDILKDVDPTYYLMIDTIVASQGRAFIGTWRSTFTGYITRLRGYYNYPTEFSWYFWDESKKDYQALSLAEETEPRSPFFMREWPTAWKDIDKEM